MAKGVEALVAVVVEAEDVKVDADTDVARNYVALSRDLDQTNELTRQNRTVKLHAKRRLRS